MRVIGLVLALGAVSPAGAEPAAALRPFQFKSLTATMTAPIATAAGLAERCRTLDIGRGPQSICGLGATLAEDGTAGVAARRSSLKFDDGGLLTMSWEMFRADVPTVRAAFEERYGKPCRTETPQLQNGYGAIFTSTITTWCFAEGDLILSERSLSDPSHGEFLFMAHRYRRALENPKPKVNF